MFELMKQAAKKKSKLFISAFIFYIFCAFLIYYLEPNNFKSPFNGFWWVMTTVTTVGYGDFSPQTVAGKIIGIILFIFGIGLIGVIIGMVFDSFSYYRMMKVDGKLSYKGKNHLVVIGWSKKSNKTIKELLISPDEFTDIVLIDQQMDKSPIDNERVHFIKGDAVNTEILDKANIMDALSVAIFAPDYIVDEASADGKTLLIASAIESYGMEKGKDIYTIVEIVRKKHIKMFHHVEVDEFILSNEVFPLMMAQSITHNGASTLYMQLLSKRFGYDLWEIKPKKYWDTYEDAFEELKNLGANLIADCNDLGVIRRLKEKIPDNAKLIVLCDKETFEKI